MSLKSEASSIQDGTTSDKTKISQPLIKSSSFTFITPETETKQTTVDNNTLKNFSFAAKFTEMSKTPTSTFDLPTSTLPKAEELNKSNIFGSDATTPKNLFPTSTNLFGSNSTTFGDSTAAKSGSNIFNTTTPSNVFACKTSITPTSSSNLFASKATTNGSVPVTTPPVFGNNTTSSSSFVGSVFNTPSTIFGSSATASSNLFGKNQEVSTSPFGANAKTANPFGPINTGSLFGSNLSSTFGTTTAKFEFGKSGSIFGQSMNNANIVAKTTDLKEGDNVVLKCSSDVSFASLAKNNSLVAPEFEKASDNGDQMRPFKFCNSGAPVFGFKQNTKTDSTSNSNTSKGEADEDDDENADDNYDPHYEPIIEMPDAIEVSTGEEEETPFFNERAKLFRYDTELKEWKERGVGQMKILHHPSNGTYRLLLRREQVHKLVLNQLITPTFELQPMTTCDKAWVWAGHNFVDGQSCLEKLAVRFKHEKTAKSFFDSVKSCVSAIKANVMSKQSEEPLPTTIENYEESPTQESDQVSSNSGSDSEEDYDEERPMFSESCTLYELSQNGDWVKLCPGTIEVYYDTEMCCAKIKFTNESEDEISCSVIGINTEMKLNENECVWKTVELANKDEMYWRELRAVFVLPEIASRFHYNYLEGITYAQEWKIYDDITNHPGLCEMEPSE
ncbi:hypothetical protein WA026_013700 [Henosepilachna vigintioctopunctata]|uniref:RanBD1 domain-containing protein n=1 Tax=Henosepilachna vigintioctopunctata TaxID=420089 RepID=A0AAW1URS4_9CUCU